MISSHEQLTSVFEEFTEALIVRWFLGKVIGSDSLELPEKRAKQSFHR